MDVQEHDLATIYSWVDNMPLSRPQRNIHRDFADAVLVAEIIALYMPKLVNLHNYSPCNAMNLKLYNWATLNDKPFRKLGCALSGPERLACATATPGAVERVLKLLRHKLPVHRRSSDGLARPLTPAAALQHIARQEALAAVSETASAEGFVSRHDEQDSPTSQLDAAQQELQSHGSGCSSNAAMPEFERAGPIEGKALGDEAHGSAIMEYEGLIDGSDGAGYIAGPQGIPNTSVELVQGALGESADFLIATYGMGSEHREGAKPTAFNASAAPQSDCSKDNLAAQDRVQELERRVAELQAENERLMRVSSLKEQRCCILEEICFKKGFHVPGGLLGHQQS